MLYSFVCGSYFENVHVQCSLSVAAGASIASSSLPKLDITVILEFISFITSYQNISLGIGVES